MVIKMCTIEGEPICRGLLESISYIRFDGSVGNIPVGFVWDGSSVPFGFNAVFPRHRHPVASCRHDWRCKHAESNNERKFADKQFELDVGKTSSWVVKKFGYIGVRIGAFLGIGNKF